MLDIQKTITLIKNGLIEPRATWQSYLAENRGWQETAMLVTLPLILASMILAGLMSLIFGSRVGYGFGGWLIGLIMAVAGIGVTAFIFSFLAGVFKGTHDFNKGLAALSLAAIPGYLGNVVSVVPFIGWIVSFALGIVSLVFLYKIIPLYLKVPDDKRVLHYIASLVTTFIAMAILVALLGGSMMSSQNAVSMSGEQPTQASMFGGVERYARMMEKAGEQQYDPPSDGRVSEAQMDRYMEVMRKTAEFRDEQSERMAKLQEKYEDKEPGFKDLADLSGGLGSVMSTFTAEMEVVMTGDGNWAEHQWISEQLRVARVQKDINQAVKHNYALYQAREDELQELSATY